MGRVKGEGHCEGEQEMVTRKRKGEGEGAKKKREETRWKGKKEGRKGSWKCRREGERVGRARLIGKSEVEKERASLIRKDFKNFDKNLQNLA